MRPFAESTGGLTIPSIVRARYIVTDRYFKRFRDVLPAKKWLSGGLGRSPVPARYFGPA
jgi:hypothetical protein